MFKVLIVDDSKDWRMLLEEVIKEEGFEVITGYGNSQ